MLAGSVRHSLIASATLVAIHTRLNHDNFAVSRGDVKILVNGRFRCPDITVFRWPCNLDADIAHDPVVVIEVVTASTRIVDRFDKNVDYASGSSIEHYLMLSDSERSAVLCSRAADGWISSDVSGQDLVPLPAIGMELSLDDLYRNIEFRISAS